MSFSIFWILADRARAGLQNPEAFLSPVERKKLAAMRFPKRREEWLLGRWSAKQLAHSLPEYQHIPLNEVEIRSTTEGAPYISIPHGTCPPHSLSISHSGELAFCALTLAGGLTVGADLEKVEPRTDEFVKDYFTPLERDLVNSYPREYKSLAANLIWSAKESMLKALGVGLRWDTRRVEVVVIEGLAGTSVVQEVWQELKVGVSEAGQGGWQARWQTRDGFVLTLVVNGEEFQSFDLVERRI